MCLAVPGLLTDVFLDGDTRMGKVNFDGVVRRVCLECVPQAAPGDYVLVHVGFALSTIDADEARRVFELLKEISDLDAPESGERSAADAPPEVEVPP